MLTVHKSLVQDSIAKLDSVEKMVKNLFIRFPNYLILEYKNNHISALLQLGISYYEVLADILPKFW